jgi:hypothetical protein
VSSSASAAGATSAAPSPCAARAASRTPAVDDSPQASDASPNNVIPAMKALRRPARSAQRPAASRNPPNVNV